MADIELVIKIPKEVYKHAKEIHEVMCDSVWLGIKNGTPLPKGHGRLIDVIQLKAKIFDLPGRVNGSYWDGVDDVGDLIDNASTIIEADKAESEDK